LQEEAFVGNRGVHDRIGWCGEKKPKPASECSKFEDKNRHRMCSSGDVHVLYDLHAGQTPARDGQRKRRSFSLSPNQVGQYEGFLAESKPKLLNIGGYL
jgi:hypothetical protein